MKAAFMISQKPNIFIRSAKLSDTSELCGLLNEIIQIGGTTAIETPLTNEEFAGYFLKGENHISCYVAENEAGLLIGFQALEHHPKLSADWADIATFARIKPKTPGVGTALFEGSKTQARNARIVAINATIRADNASGLAYYDKMGFQTYSVNANIPLRDGAPVDRISKRFFVE